MNTTHRAPRKISNLSALPVELWLDILRLATWVPEIMEPHGILEFRSTHIRDLKRLYRQSLVTKRYVVRVSKQWYHWAAPYLYESILIGRGKCLKPLRDALATSSEAARAGVTDFSLGEWVKRLDLAMRDMSDDRVESDNQIRYLSDIIHCLPNLAIISFAARPYHVRFIKNYGTYYPSSILQTVANSCGHNLQAIAWQDWVAGPRQEEWHALLQQAKNLKALRPPRLLQVESPPHLTLPYLESLYLQGDSLDNPNNHFASLQHLVVDHFPPGDKVQPFVQKHGKKLEAIQLKILGGGTLAYDAKSALSLYCPKLLRMDVLVSQWEQVTDIQLPNTIRILGLANFNAQSSRSVYRDFLTRLQSMAFNHALQYIQFIDRGNVADLRSKHMRELASASRALRERGLMLKDHEDSVIE